MSAPLIGMSFASFVVVTIVSGIAGAIIHWGFRYRLFQGIDGCLGQWIVAWLARGWGPAVLGHWFGSAMVSEHLYRSGFHRGACWRSRRHR